MSAGCVFYVQNSGPAIKLAFGPSYYESDFVDGVFDQYMPMNRIWEWAVENNDNGEVNALVLPQKKDIWLLGVMALELLYGQLLVLSHNDFMLIIDYVNRHPGLPRNWTQLRHNALYNPGNMISSPAVSPLYVCFVKSCFAAFQIRP